MAPLALPLRSGSWRELRRPASAGILMRSASDERGFITGWFCDGVGGNASGSFAQSYPDGATRRRDHVPKRVRHALRESWALCHSAGTSKKSTTETSKPAVTFLAANYQTKDPC